MAKFKTNDDYFAYSKTLTAIPTEDLAQLLIAHKIKIPYYIHRFVLKETLYAKVFQPNLYQTFTDELKYRLRGYHQYSLFLLEKLIKDFNLDFDAAKYKEILFNLLFVNRDLYRIKDGMITDLEKLKYKYNVDFEKISYGDFIKSFLPIFYEPTGYLDGVNLSILKDVLIHSSTLGDLRGLGEKYNVKIPRRINKNQLVDILSARFRLSEADIELINTKSVLELEIYAKEKGFNISIDLKKSDMVEYLVFSLSLYHQEQIKDTHSYQIPLAADIDSVQVDAIEFETNDQDIPVTTKEAEVEPIQEDVVQPVEEEVVVETPVMTGETPVHEEEVIAPVVEETVAPEPEEPKEAVVSEPEPEVVEEPVVEQPVQKEPIQPTKAPVISKPEEPLDFTDEEKALLDDKINQIIRKYNRKKRTKRFWTIFILVIVGAIVLFGGYVALYYFYLNPGVMPFGLPNIF